MQGQNSKRLFSFVTGVEVLMVSSFVLLSTPLMVFGQEGIFDLIRQDSQLCKFEWKGLERNQQPTLCLKLNDPEKNQIDIYKQSDYLLHHEKPENFFSEESDEYIHQIGGSFLLEKEDLNYVTENYSVLTLEDLSVEWEKAEWAPEKSKDRSQPTKLMKMPFMGRLLWKNKEGLSGVLLIDGSLELTADDLFQNRINETANEKETSLKDRVVSINQYADECVSHKNDLMCMRFMSRLVRLAHFKVLQMKGIEPKSEGEGSMEKATLHLLRGIVGKVVIGELLNPLIHDVQNFFQFLEQGTNRIQQELEKAAKEGIPPL